MKLAQPVGFITEKLVTMHGHMYVKLVSLCLKAIILRGKNVCKIFSYYYGSRLT